MNMNNYERVIEYQKRSMNMIFDSLRKFLAKSHEPLSDHDCRASAPNDGCPACAEREEFEVRQDKGFI